MPPIWKKRVFLHDSSHLFSHGFTIHRRKSATGSTSNRSGANESRIMICFELVEMFVFAKTNAVFGIVFHTGACCDLMASRSFQNFNGPCQNLKRPCRA
jgi:hypothetical protein